MTDPLDMSKDPDRYDPARDDRTLPEMLGEGAHEDRRDNHTWLLGLLAVISFLVLVSLLVQLA
jgi:hypothetical protein